MNNKKAPKSEEESEKTIQVAFPAYHLEEMKEFFIAELMSLIKYYEMNQAIYGEDNHEAIASFKRKIEAIKKIVNGETLSRRPLRELRWGTLEKWKNVCLDIADGLHEEYFPEEDKMYTEIKKRRMLEEQERQALRKHSKNE